MACPLHGQQQCCTQVPAACKAKEHSQQHSCTQVPAACKAKEHSQQHSCTQVTAACKTEVCQQQSLPWVPNMLATACKGVRSGDALAAAVKLSEVTCNPEPSKPSSFWQQQTPRVDAGNCHIEEANHKSHPDCTVSAGVVLGVCLAEASCPAAEPVRWCCAFLPQCCSCNPLWSLMTELLCQAQQVQQSWGVQATKVLYKHCPTSKPTYLGLRSSWRPEPHTIERHCPAQHGSGKP